MIRVLILLLTAEFSFAAVSPANREIIRTQVNFLFHEKDYSTAKELLHSHLKEDKEDEVAWNLLGLTYLKSKDNDRARKAFRQAIKFASAGAKGIYFYHYADAAARGGKLKAARKSLKIARRYDPVSSSAEDALETLRSGQSLPPLEIEVPSKWTGSAGITSGYDTNVLLTPDASSTATDVASPYFTIMGQVAHHQSLLGGQFTNNLASSFTYNILSDATPFNSWYNFLRTEVYYPKKSSGGFSDRIYNHFGLSFIDSTSFLFWKDAIGWNSQVGPPTSSWTFNLEAYFQKYAFDSTTSEAADDRTGFGFYPRASYFFYWGHHTMRFGLDYTLHLASGDNYKTHTIALPIDWTWPFNPKLSLNANTTASYVFYPSASNGRTDPILKTSYILNWKFSQSWYSNLGYSFTWNGSNDAEVKYNKHIINLSVNYVIL